MGTGLQFAFRRHFFIFSCSQAAAVLYSEVNEPCQHLDILNGGDRMIVSLIVTLRSVSFQIMKYVQAECFSSLWH